MDCNSKSIEDTQRSVSLAPPASEAPATLPEGAELLALGAGGTSSRRSRVPAPTFPHARGLGGQLFPCARAPADRSHRAHGPRRHGESAAERPKLTITGGPRNQWHDARFPLRRGGFCGLPGRRLSGAEVPCGRRCPVSTWRRWVTEF